jgi:tetratricopeptide (TPR) repeat protein
MKDHKRLVTRAYKLHEARRYSAALKSFKQASRIAPKCPVITYGIANAMHMLGRDVEAYPLLKELVRVEPAELGRRCPACNPRSLQLDAYFLLFKVVLDGHGFCAEAFKYADEHLRRRRRGLHSVWSMREVRSDIEAMRRDWRSTSRKALGRTRSQARA